jgi:benzylsuccinate CoA-transferase BbsF subunit
VAGLVTDPHLQARGLFMELESPIGGTHVAMRAPWHVEPGLQPQYTPAPRLGQDNEYVFRTLLGLSEPEVAQLVADGVAF